MANILFICSATSNLYMGISNGTTLLSTYFNDAREHAVYINKGLNALIEQASISLQDLDAVAISTGPGSYTGLRVGYASAKALCVALDICLLPIPTLHAQAYACKDLIQETYIFSTLDARRNEVFGLFLNKQFEELDPTQPIILDSNPLLEKYKALPIALVGNGSEKSRTYFNQAKIYNFNNQMYAKALSYFAYKSFVSKNYLDVVNSVPYYGKEVYTTTPK